MLNIFRLTLAACAAVGVAIAGAHVASVYGDTMFVSKVKAIMAADSAVKASSEADSDVGN